MRLLFAPAFIAGVILAIAGLIAAAHERRRSRQ